MPGIIDSTNDQSMPQEDKPRGRLGFIVLVALGVVIGIYCYWHQKTAENQREARPDQSLLPAGQRDGSQHREPEIQAPPPWWAGAWQGEVRGKVWRLTLDAKGWGRIVKPETGIYYLEQQIIDFQGGEDGVLFAIDYRVIPSRPAEKYYLLMLPEGADDCLLYRSQPPPQKRLPNSRLVAVMPETGSTPIGRLKRLSAEEAAKPSVPGIGPGIK